MEKFEDFPSEDEITFSDDEDDIHDLLGSGEIKTNLLNTGAQVQESALAVVDEETDGDQAKVQEGEQSPPKETEYPLVDIEKSQKDIDDRWDSTDEIFGDFSFDFRALDEKPLVEGPESPNMFSHLAEEFGSTVDTALPSLGLETTEQEGKDKSDFFAEINSTIDSYTAQEEKAEQTYLIDDFTISAEPIDVEDSESSQKLPDVSPVLIEYEGSLRIFYSDIADTCTKTDLLNLFKDKGIVSDLLTVEEFSSKLNDTSATESDEADDRVSFNRFLLLLDTVAKSSFEIKELEPHNATLKSKVYMLLMLLDPEGKTFIGATPEKKISAMEILTICKNSRQEKLWKAAMFAQKAGKLIQTRIQKKQQKPQTPKQSSTTEKPTKDPKQTYVWTSKTKDFLGRMENDLKRRRRKKSELQYAKEEALKNIITRKPVISRGSVVLLEATGQSSKECTIQRLHLSREESMQKLIHKYCEQDIIDQTTGQRLFHPVINRNSKQMFELDTSRSKDNRAKTALLTTKILHDEAKERIERQKQAVETHEMNIEISTSRPKAMQRSLKYLQEKLDREISKIFASFDSGKTGYLPCSYTLLLLQHFGLVPDVLLMNLQETGKERNFVLALWKLLRVEAKAEGALEEVASLNAVTELVHNVILGSSERPHEWIYLNTQSDGKLADKVIRQLRLNYNMRSRRSKFAGKMIQQTVLPRGSKGPSTKPPSSKNAPVTYTLDGRVADGENMNPGITERRTARAAKQNVIRSEMFHNEIRECTFHPKVNVVRNTEDSDNGTTSCPFTRLYEDAMERTLTPKTPSTHVMKEIEQLEACTFTPEGPSRNTPEERMDLLRRKLEKCPPPNGYGRHVHQARKALKRRAEIKQILEGPFQPSDISAYRDADRRIVQEPFNLRAYDRSKMKQRSKRVQEKIQRLALAHQRSELLLHIDVHLAPNWTESIDISRGDVPERAVSWFAHTHKLGQSRYKRLLLLVQRELNKVKKAERNPSLFKSRQYHSAEPTKKMLNPSKLPAEENRSASTTDYPEDLYRLPSKVMAT